MSIFYLVLNKKNFNKNKYIIIILFNFLKRCICDSSSYIYIYKINRYSGMRQAFFIEMKVVRSKGLNAITEYNLDTRTSFIHTC